MPVLTQKDGANGKGAGKAPGLSFGALASAVAERWKALGALERQPHEDVAAADKERYDLEMKAWGEEAFKAKPVKRKRSSISSGEAGVGEGGGAVVKRAASLDGGASGAAAASEGSEGGATGVVLPTFPMDESLLLVKEARYRAYLVAAGRSLPPPEGAATPPAFVYPPVWRVPPPPVLPPLPSMPVASPLRLSLSLPDSALSRLLMLWDMGARLGGTFRLAPCGMPLCALSNLVS